MRNTCIFAHRGASQEAAENTHSAFLKALAHGVDGIETDVQLSRDGVPILWHDDDLERIGLPGRHIEDYEASVLVTLKLNGEPLFSLADLLTEFAHRSQWLLEIKHARGESTQRQRLKVRTCLERALPFREAGARILFSSFHLDSLIYAHHLTEAFPYVCNSESITSRDQVEALFASHSFLAGLCLPIEHLAEELASCIRAQNKLLAVYTCNSEAEIGRALACGVNILISDDPAAARRAELGYNRRR